MSLTWTWWVRVVCGTSGWKSLVGTGKSFPSGRRGSAHHLLGTGRVAQSQPGSRGVAPARRFLTPGPPGLPWAPLGDGREQAASHLGPRPEPVSGSLHAVRAGAALPSAPGPCRAGLTHWPGPGAGGRGRGSCITRDQLPPFCYGAARAQEGPRAAPCVSGSGTCLPRVTRARSALRCGRGSAPARLRGPARLLASRSVPVALSSRREDP